MRFYGMGYREMLDLPMATFWMLDRQIERVQAEESAQRAQDFVAAQSSEGLKARVDDIKRSMGEPVIDNRKRPEDTSEHEKLMRLVNGGVSKRG